MTPEMQVFINLYRNNNNIIHMQIKGVTQAESLIQPPYRGNCLNWVVGHLLCIRGECLELLGLPGLMTETEKASYGYGSEPITGCDQGSDLDSLVERLDKSLGILLDELGCLSAQDLERESRIWRGPVPLREAISFMLWHETYHTGQLEQLRQLTGKNDHVI